jgi:Domain of unknown function (DUF3303)
MRPAPGRARRGGERSHIGSAFAHGWHALCLPLFRRKIATAGRRIAMLFHCQFTWFPGTTRQEVAQRVVQQHDAGANHPERIKGWYNLAGGGAGFLLVDYDDPKELTAFLQPYMDLIAFDVRAVTENNYKDRIEELRKVAQGTT